MNWVEVTVQTDGEAAEAVSERLRPFAYDQSVVLEQLGDIDNLDPYALEPVVTVKIYFPGDDQAAGIQQRIEEAIYFLGLLYPIPAPIFRVLQEEDWANAWRVHYEPFRVGQRLWIQPSWQPAQEAAVGDVVLTLDPGMAFGTGLHPTTQMCLLALEQLVKPDIAMLDVGTGSGILAVAAARLGATRVLGVDTDDLAVRAAQGNALTNGVAEQVRIGLGSLHDIDPSSWDLVVVNILAPVIESLLRNDHLLEYVVPGGFLVLSGIIDEQVPAIAAAIAESGGEIIQTYAIRDWVALIVQPLT